jgi:hypothetical protein
MPAFGEKKSGVCHSCQPVKRSSQAPEAMNKRCYTHNEEQLLEGLSKRCKKTEWTKYKDHHPSAFDWQNPSNQNCQICEEPLQDHKHHVMERYWDTMIPISFLKCDRKVIRTYYWEIPLIFDETGESYTYDVFIRSTLYDVYELNEGRKTQ